MRYLLTLLLLSCGAVPSGKPDVDALAWSLCNEHEAVCVPSSVKAEYLDSLLLDEDFYWGRFSYGTVQLPGADVRYGVVCYDDERCQEDIEACGFVLLHEIGHLRAGSDQTDADCWAAQRATPEQYAAGVELVCSFRDRPRCEALKECAP